MEENVNITTLDNITRNLTMFEPKEFKTDYFLLKNSEGDDKVTKLLSRRNPG